MNIFDAVRSCDIGQIKKHIARINDVDKVSVKVLNNKMYQL